MRNQDNKFTKDDQNIIETDSGNATESDVEEEVTIDNEEPYTREIVWPNVYKFIILHSLFLYGLTFLPSLSINPGSGLLLPTGFQD